MYNLWKEKSLWLYFDLPSGKYILVDFAIEPITLMLRWHEFWNKDVHRYTLSDNGKKVRDDRLLSAELISVVGCDIKGKDQPKLKETIDVLSPPREWGVGGVVSEDSNKKKPDSSSHSNDENEREMIHIVQSEEQNLPEMKEVNMTKEPRVIHQETILSDAELGIDDFV